MTHIGLSGFDAAIGFTVQQHLFAHEMTRARLGELLGVPGQSVSSRLRGKVRWTAGDLAVAEMVGLGRLPYLKSWQLGSSKEKDIIARSLATVGISGLADRPCDQLSGGQRRRALLARGFAQETDLVLLDEPTNHLDVHHQLHLLGVLRDSGRTIIATIHDLDLAMSYFDQVVVLHQGGMLCAGHPQDVLIPDNLRKVFDVQALIAQLPEATNPHLIIDSL